jgi:DNA primase
MSTWIDFKELRSKLSTSAVLEHYKIQLKMKHNRASGFCPLPTHEGRRASPSFSLKIDRGIWQCFGCGARGNLLDLCARMEGHDPRDPQALRKAAEKIVPIFGLERGPLTQPPQEQPKRIDPLINPPMDFTLQALDADHPYPRDRGLTSKTIRHFGLGYCNRGMLKARLAIPLHDYEGRLVGYAGRLTDDREISEQRPKYLFPGSRERDGRRIEFRKSLLVYNGHHIREPVDHLFVTEGFVATWLMWQFEYRTTVALMGASCSDEQADIIVKLVKPDGKVWLLSDGDDAGKRCAISAFERIAPRRFVRWPQLPPGTQISDFSGDEIAAILNP